MLKFQESRIVSERDMKEVARVVDSRLIENNESNNQQENAANLISEAVQGLREELGGSRNNDRKLQANQRMGQRIEDERNMEAAEIRKILISAQTQEGRRQEGVRYEQANVRKYSNVGLKGK